MTTPTLLTETQAAEALSISPRTLRKARQEGRIAHILIGRAVRYTMDDIARFVEASRQDVRPCDQHRPPAPRRTARHRGGNIVPFSQRH